MGFSIRGALSSVASVGRTALRSPLGKIAGLIPGVGTALNLGSLALTGYGAYKALSGGGSSAPPPMSMPLGGAPLQGIMGGPGTAYPNMGKRSIFRDDPNVSEQLKPYAIDDRFLKTYHRGPRGTVVLHDSVGDAFAIPKAIAIAHHLWKPAKKPVISVGDWSKLMGANRVVKKFKEIEKKAMRIANFHSPRRARPMMIAQTPGKKVLLTR